MTDEIATGKHSDYTFDHRFSAVVLADALPDFTIEALREAARPVLPSFADNLKLQEITGFRTAKTFMVAGRLMTIIALDRPAQNLERAVAMAENKWPDVGQAIAPHKCQLLVTTGGPATSSHEAFRDASFVSVAAAALTQLVPARAIYFPSGETLLAPEVFRQIASGLARNVLPLQLWLQLIPLEIARGEGAAKQNAIVSEGFRAFTGRELEFAMSDVPIGEMAARLLGFAEKLIVEGPVAQHGKTFGMSVEDKCRIEMRDEGLRPNIPVIRLVPEHIVPMLKSNEGA